MIRDVILEATGEVSTTLDAGVQASRDPGSSDYPWANTPSNTLAVTWSDDDNETFWYCWPEKTNGGAGLILATFTPPPTLATFRKVTLQAWWSYQQQGPNGWIFPPTNANGPRFRLAIRNRAKDGNLFSAYHEITGAEIVDQYENISTGSPGVYLGPKLFEWELLSHPDGGPFVLDDLSVANFAAGIEASAAAPAFNNASGSFLKLRVHKLCVKLEIEDLGGYVQNIRHHASVDLRWFRRARNAINTRTLLGKSVGNLGDVIWASRPGDAPAVLASGWGERTLERRSAQVLKRIYLPQQGGAIVEDQCFDRQSFACLLWAAYRIDAPWSPELQGLAYLDKGAGFEHARAQDAWSPRPVDGVLLRVLEDYPNLSREGLVCQGGGDVELCLQNWDILQDGWTTVSDVGDFTATADTTVSLVEEQGYLTSGKLTYGAAGGTGGRARGLGTLPRASGDLIHVRVILKNTSVTTPATEFGEWYLTRTGGGLAATEYWDATTRAWTTTATYNAIPSTDAYGESISDCIPCNAAGATSDPTYAIGVGRFSSAMSSVTLHGAIINVTHGGYGARSPLIANAATVTRVSDVHHILNSSASEVWDYALGVAVVEARPFFRADNLVHADMKPLIHAQHGADTHDCLQFVPVTGSDDFVRFERAVSGEVTFTLDCLIPTATVELTRDHVLRAWVRYLGSDGWNESAPYSVEVGYLITLASDGSKVHEASVVGTLTYTGDVAARDWVGVGCDETRQFDGTVRLVEVRRNPIHRLEALYKV